MTARKQRPLVYSCSGCSDVAQLANNVAVRLDHAGEFEMSCISGVGGKVPSLVKTARSGRPITVIDGCPLHCARACLENISSVLGKKFSVLKTPSSQPVSARSKTIKWT